MGTRGIKIDVYYSRPCQTAVFSPHFVTAIRSTSAAVLKKSLQAQLAELDVWLSQNPDQVIVLDLENNMNQSIDSVGGQINDPYN